MKAEVRSFGGATDTNSARAPRLPNGLPVLATAAYSGDIAVRLDSIGTVESSNSVVFSIQESVVQEVVKRFGGGEVLTVEAEDREGKAFGHGVLRGVDNQIDTSTGTLRCTATLTPDGGQLMVRGLFFTVHLVLEVKHGVTLVPVEAIQLGTDGAYVWAIKPDQTVSRRVVQVGARDGGKVEIQSGLAAGELVVTDGAFNLREGQKITYKVEGNQSRAASVEERAAALQFRLVAAEGTTERVELLRETVKGGVVNDVLVQHRVLPDVLMDGTAVARAGIEFEASGERTIQMQLTEAGAKRFEEITASNIGRQIAIVYHERVLSAPRIATKVRGGIIPFVSGLGAEEIHEIVDCLNRAPAPTEETWAFTTPRVPIILLAQRSQDGARALGRPPTPSPLNSPTPSTPDIQDLPGLTRSYLDLDTGKMVTNESVNWKTREGHDWISSNGLDLAAAVASIRAAVMTGFDMVIAPLPPDTPANPWGTLTAADVVQSWTLMQTEPKQTVAFGVSPLNLFLFQTREGGRGILRIAGLAEDVGKGNVVILSYKLVERGGAGMTNSAAGTGARGLPGQPLKP
jgi:hypothetical protein